MIPVIKRRKKRAKYLWLLLILAVLGGYGYRAINRPFPSLSPVTTSTTIKVKTPPAQLTWPAAGQSAVGIVGTNILEKNGASKPVPTASTAKLITALVILKQKPLGPGQQGPLITLTDKDVEIYKNYVARDGSVVPVQAGEQISEYQALQAVLLPSSNNMADTLAIWAYGSLEAYAAAANQYLADHGLDQTHVGKDASGLSADSTSTAADLVEVGKLAMENPVLASIVGQTTATGIPLVGTIKNVNSLLGTDGIVGIKTGNSDEAGGAYVAAALVKVNGKTETVVTAVMGSPSLFSAMKDSLPLVRSAQANFKPVNVVDAGQVVGQQKLPWGGSVPTIAAKGLTITAWNGSIISAQTKLQPTQRDITAGQAVGQLSTNAAGLSDKQSVKIELASTPAKPPLWWSLLHPLR